MVFVGMDHGTTGISFAIMNERQVLDVFKISREDSKAGKVSAIEELSKRVNLDDIELMIITYAMGDGINRILPIEKSIGFFQLKRLKIEEFFKLGVQVR